MPGVVDVDSHPGQLLLMLLQLLLMLLLQL
jgi:hypothetical protein